MASTFSYSRRPCSSRELGIMGGLGVVLGALGCLDELEVLGFLGGLAELTELGVPGFLGELAELAELSVLVYLAS